MNTPFTPSRHGRAAEPFGSRRILAVRGHSGSSRGADRGQFRRRAGRCRAAHGDTTPRPHRVGATPSRAGHVRGLVDRAADGVAAWPHLRAADRGLLERQSPPQPGTPGDIGPVRRRRSPGGEPRRPEPAARPGCDACGHLAFGDAAHGPRATAIFRPGGSARKAARWRIEENLFFSKVNSCKDIYMDARDRVSSRQPRAPYRPVMPVRP